MKKIIIIIAFVVLILGALGTAAAYFSYRTLIQYGDEPVNVAAPIELKVERGTSLTRLTGLLDKQHIIKDSWKLKWLIKLKPELSEIRSGLYEVTPDDSIYTLLNKLVLGKEKAFYVTLLEGQTIKEWSTILASAPHLQFEADAFTKVLQHNNQAQKIAEGLFFPDTYQYRAGESVNKIADISFKKMQSVVASIWEGRQKGLPLKSPYELLILASIIEKETGQGYERPWISAVFINRLRKGMRLQTDPTVIYGMGDRYKGNIRRKDLRERTAYNTYRINGLPPSPIAAPSLAAIEAAAHPADVDYLYFVSKNDGSHVFSKTLLEHNRAVNKYQRNR